MNSKSGLRYVLTFFARIKPCFPPCCLWAFLCMVLLASAASTLHANDIETEGEQAETINETATEADAIINLKLPVVANVGKLEFRECTVKALTRDRTIQCAWYEVPENYDKPDGKKIKLFVGRLPAKRKSKVATDPMLFLAGGPGGAASQSYLYIDRPFSKLSRSRDFYLVDQRGTGYSNFLDCDEAVEDIANLSGESDENAIKESVLACLRVLPGDSRYYTTSVAIKDFDSLRTALDLKQWNLLGASYGTRVAVHYMRRHPQSIRGVVLDAVVPPDHVLGSEVVLQSQKILDYLYARCQQNKECSVRFPDLRERVDELLQRLEESPIDIEVENFTNGALEKVTFSKVHLLGLIRIYLYATNNLALLPPMLYEAAVNQNFAALARAATSTMESLQGMISAGMHNAVMCTEDLPFLALDEDTIQQHKNTYIGYDFVKNLKTVCEVWPAGVIDKDLKLPLESAIPTLIFSGEKDPITPPEYGAAVHKYLENSKHLVLKGQGHGVSALGCAPRLVTRFVEDASVANLDGSCLERIIESPLFINFNGPLP